MPGARGRGAGSASTAVAAAMLTVLALLPVTTLRLDGAGRPGALKQGVVGSGGG